MDKLVLHPTDTSQWHALVSEAQALSAMNLSEDTESYLVFMLMRYCQHATLIESILALEFLESHQSFGQARADKLQEVGDKSLLFSGLFPGMAQKRRVHPKYFVHIGQSAYYGVSESDSSQCNDLFLQLCQSFECMLSVLNAMRSDYLSDRLIDNLPNIVHQDCHLH